MYTFAHQEELVQLIAYVERRLDDVHEEIMENQSIKVIEKANVLITRRLVWEAECSKDEYDEDENNVFSISS